MLTLEQFQGKALLLVFVRPDCPICQDLIPDLVDVHKSGKQVVMISTGTVEQNKEIIQKHQIPFHVGRQERWLLFKSYGVTDVPSACLIDDAGMIASSIVSGYNDIMALVK